MTSTPTWSSHGASGWARPRGLSIDMFPEDGCLHVYGVGEDGVVAFTQDGIDNLPQIIEDERKAGNAPPKSGAIK